MGIRGDFDQLVGGLDLSDQAKATLVQFGQSLDPYEAIDPAKASAALQQSGQLQGINQQLATVTTERDSLQAELGQERDRANQAGLQLDTYRGLSQAGLRPEYEELVLPFAQRSLSRNEAGDLVAGDLSAGDFFNGLKSRFPDAFHAEGDGAGTGGVADGGQPSGTGPQTVQATDGVVSGVDPSKVLSGDVQISA